MKREILFRGKRVDNGEWVYGSYHKVDDDVSLIIHKHHNNLAMNTQIHPETVGQYTGLTDKNGTKIFEGDIVLAGNITCEVVFKGLKWCAKWNNPKTGYLYPDLNFRKLELIGNIHDKD